MIASDAALRSSVGALIAQTEGLQLASAHSDSNSALVETARERPHVVVIDADAGGISAFDCARCVRAISAETQILILLRRTDDASSLLCLEAGASAWLPRENPPKVPAAVLALARDGAALAKKTLLWLSRFAGRLPAGGTVSQHLTAREREVAVLLALGCSPKDVASRLRLSLGTVRAHQANLYRKLAVHHWEDLPRVLSAPPLDGARS